MNSSLWGPPIWKMMFACSWSLDPSDAALFSQTLFEDLPLLLPCSKCRDNMIAHIPVATRMCKETPCRPEHFFRWCWYLKHEVNRLTHHPDLPLSELVDRYVLHGGHVDEVELADALVLFAVSSRRLGRDEVFIRFCHSLAQLLPVDAESAIRQTLGVVDRPIVNAAHRCARQTRLQHGRPPLVVTHYRQVAS